MTPKEILMQAQQEYMNLQVEQEAIYNRTMVALGLEPTNDNDFVFDFLANQYLSVDQTLEALRQEFPDRF